MPEYRFGLTMRDENVPEGYIPIYNLFTEKKYALPGCEEFWCIGEERLKRMRFDAYHEVKKRFELCKAVNYAKFWNGNLDAINDLGINPFGNLLHFKELASVMICFQTTEENKVSGKKRKMISWGISDKIYREYYRAQREAAKTSEPAKPVRLYDQHKKRTGNMFKLPRVKILFDTEHGDKQVVKLRRNALYNQFEFWCAANRLTKSEGIYQAIGLLIEQYPVEGLEELGAYERKCDLDYSEVLIPDTTPENSVSTTVWIPKKVHMKMREIIDRWNKDPENIGSKQMAIPAYVTQAVDELNKRAPLRYSDPEAYQEHLKAIRAEEYNKAIIGE